MYQPRREARTQSIDLRHVRYHLRTWGEPGNGAVPLVLLHGWMDIGASFQFVVDALAGDRFAVAPDWRGFGRTETAPTDHHAFADYLGDLDALLDCVAGSAPVDLVGHSMGGNIAMAYAGVRPHRVRRLVNLEGFGLPATRPAQAPGRYARWLDDLRRLAAGELDLKTYDDAAGVARRLVRTNPRLAPDRADWLARHWAQPGADGRWRILGDAAHKAAHPQLFRVDEMLALYARIAAPVLAVESDGDSIGQFWPGIYSLAEYHDRLAAVPDCRTAVVADAGHMLHHDQPHAVAALLQDFLAGA